MKLQDLINKLLRDEIIIHTNLSQTYKCKCGTKLKRQSIRRHQKTKKHNNWLRNKNRENIPEEIDEKIDEKMECKICYSIRGDFYTCKKCKNQHCVDCHKHMKKCPFCRHEFKKKKRQIKHNKLLFEFVSFNLSFCGTSILNFLEEFGEQKTCGLFHYYEYKLWQLMPTNINPPWDEWDDIFMCNEDGNYISLPREINII